MNIAEVALQARVSKATVSRFLNGRNIRPTARDRLSAVIERLGYRPNRLAQGLKSRRSTTIGMVVPDISNPFFPEVVKGAERAAQAAGFHLILANTAEDSDVERQHLETLKALRVDGCLLVPAPRAARAAAERAPSGSLEAPVVYVDRAPPFAADLVCVDNTLAGEEAVRHLWRLGHRRIALLTVDARISVHLERTRGYTRALRALGAAEDASTIVRCAPTIPDGVSAMQRLLD